MSDRFHAVIWDVDGVLIDSEQLHLDNLVEFCRRHGHPWSEQENSGWLGRSLKQMWAEIPMLRGFGLTFDETLAELCDYYVARVHGRMARAPAPHIVGRIAARGVPQGVASSSPRRIVEANVAAVGVDGHLGAVVAVDDVANGKPAPDLYLEAASRLGVPPGDCLAVEDTSSGVAAARAAGLTVVAWPHEMTAGMDFSRADFRLDNLEAFDWDTVGLR